MAVPASAFDLGIEDSIFRPQTLIFATSGNISRLANRAIPDYAEHVTVLSAPSLTT